MKTCCLCVGGNKYVYDFEHILADLHVRGTWAHVACIQTARAAAQKAAEAQGAPRSLRTGFRMSQIHRSPHCSG